MKSRFLSFIFVVLISLLLTACSSDEAGVILDEPESAATLQVEDMQATSTPDPLAVVDENAPWVVISTRSLRVRAEPADAAKVIHAVRQHERYVLLAISADGKYLKLEIPDLAEGAGWVDANFVTIQGDITNIERGVIAKSEPTNDEPTGTKTPKSKVTASETPTSETPASENSVTLPTATPAIAESATVATVATNGQRLRVRKEPLADSPITGRVEDGASVTVVEKSKDGKWSKIAAGGKDNPEGGWVATEFLEMK